MSDAPNPELDLASFEAPPVEEVAFAIQFAEPQLSLEDMVDIGRALSKSLPIQQLQPPMPRMVEPIQGPTFSISTTVGIPLPRFWFVSDDGLRLIQVQEDRLAFNWRRLGRGVPYPRYAKLRAEFAEHLVRIADVVQAVRELQADFCELTYVNELAAPDLEQGQLPLDAVLRAARPLDNTDFLPPPEDAQWSARWSIREGAAQEIGRLTASAQPVLRQRDQQPIYLLTMTAALPGESSGSEAAFARLDLAHEWIVRGFADLTTKTMHDIWKRMP